MEVIGSIDGKWKRERRESSYMHVHVCAYPPPLLPFSLSLSLCLFTCIIMSVFLWNRIEAFIVHSSKKKKCNNWTTKRAAVTRTPNGRINRKAVVYMTRNYQLFSLTGTHSRRANLDSDSLLSPASSSPPPLKVKREGYWKWWWWWWWQRRLQYW